MKSTIVLFLSGKGTDERGRYLRDLQLKNSIYYRYSDDYLPWMFPTKEIDPQIKNCPVLTDQDIYEIQHDLIMQEHILRSLDAIFRCYGLKREENDIKKGSLFFLKKHNWEYEKLSRIITCLKLVDLDVYADALQREIAKESDYSFS